MSFRIPAGPPVSSCTQSPSSSCPFVSSCIPWVPRMRDTAVTSRGSETDSQSSRLPSFDSVAAGRGRLEPPTSVLSRRERRSVEYAITNDVTRRYWSRHDANLGRRYVHVSVHMSNKYSADHGRPHREGRVGCTRRSLHP